MSKDPNMCRWCCIPFLGAVICILFVFINLEYFKIHTYEKTTCYIENATYPTDFPNIYTSYELWTSCRCGKGCRANYPCLRLYTKNSDDFIKESISAEGAKCTFDKGRCPDGQLITESSKFINNTIKLAESYIHTNTTCYKDKNDPDNSPIYLELNIELLFTLWITMCIISGLYIILCMYVYIKACVENCRNNDK